VKCAAGHCRLVEGILAVQGRGGCQHLYQQTFKEWIIK